MLLLTSTSDKIQVSTSDAGDIEVHASYVDLNGSTVTPGRTNTASITTATTTDVVGSPGASTQRNVKFLSLRNNHASVTNTVAVIHTDATNPTELIEALLGPGETLCFAEGAGWQRFNSAGGLVTSGGGQQTDTQVFTVGGTWTKPTSFIPKIVIVEAWGAGGGGGAGGSLATAVVCKGGGGGGGGAFMRGVFLASDLASTVAVTLGTGGTAGVPGAAGAAGGDGGGGGGGNTTFGTHLTAYGGGGGRGGAISAAVTGGGGGGGAGGAGAVGTTSGGAGGLPTAATNGSGGQGVTGTVAVSTTGNAEWGGAAGAGIAATPVASSLGGGSIRGGGGGGAGGSHSATPANVAGGAGGKSGGYSAGGGGSVGTSGASPTAGAAGAAATSTIGGMGGGGGGTTVTASTSGAAGGNGGQGGGGGGGGGAGMNPGLGGAGGVGGAGYCIVYTWWTMARIGAFDETGLPIAWWSDVGSPNGWVTDELLEGGGSPQTQPVTAATSTETANDVTPVPVVPVGAASSSEAAGSITAVRYQATPDRVFRVSVEARTLVLLYRVVEVLRTMTTALETRTLTVQAQTRTADTLSEGRTLTVGAESRTELAEGEWMLAGQQAVGETLDWRVDWSTWLGSDTISTSDWTADTGVTLGTESNTTTVATQFISGGAVGRSYQLTNTITTAGGRTAKRTITVAFVERKTE